MPCFVAEYSRTLTSIFHCRQDCAGNAPCQETDKEYYIRSYKRIENILFDPCLWFLLYLILRGHIDGISSIEEFAQRDNEELYIKSSSTDLPV